MSSVSAYNPPLYGTAVWRDEDGTTRSSRVDILAVVVESRIATLGVEGPKEGPVYFICSTADKERRTVWAYAEDVTIDYALWRPA